MYLGAVFWTGLVLTTFWSDEVEAAWTGFIFVTFCPSEGLWTIVFLIMFCPGEGFLTGLVVILTTFFSREGFCADLVSDTFCSGGVESWLLLLCCTLGTTNTDLTWTQQKGLTAI